MKFCCMIEQWQRWKFASLLLINAEPGLSCFVEQRGHLVFAYLSKTPVYDCMLNFICVSTNKDACRVLKTNPRVLSVWD